jgi:putative transposase
MVRPAGARVVDVVTRTVCLNVSGLSRVSCCCSQAMMRSARIVPG